MYKIQYNSLFESFPLDDGMTYYTVCPLASINCTGDIKQVLINHTLATIDDNSNSECNGNCDIDIITTDEKRVSCHILPLATFLDDDLLYAYEEFQHEYESVKDIGLVESVKAKMLSVFAKPDPKIADNSHMLDSLSRILPSLHMICNKPRSHLKSINEIRPIETVKRIGHESIPYLASHSEDWLARTASGLKPSRLYSRVEEDDWQIYENRVIKTIIDNAIRYLRRLKAVLTNSSDMLDEIINSNVQTDSFGFDLSHQICVSELMGNTSDDYTYQAESKAKNIINSQLRKVISLLRSYESLAHSKLYRNLRRSKHVLGPLQKTNILTMDKHYKTASSIWSDLQASAKNDSEDYLSLQSDSSLVLHDLWNTYKQYCETLCGYSVTSLGFEIEDDWTYSRPNDELHISLVNKDECFIVTIQQGHTYSILLTEDQSPIGIGSEYNGFYFNGKTLEWHQEMTETDIDQFASLLKSKDNEVSYGGKQKWQIEKEKSKNRSDQGRLYRELRQLISNENKRWNDSVRRIVLIPTMSNISDTSFSDYRKSMTRAAESIKEKYSANLAVVMLPLADKNQQRILDYAISEATACAFIPVSMYDINSYRRLRLLLIRYLTQLTNHTCPCCGNPTLETGYGEKCTSCNELYIRSTICSEPSCKKTYKYLWYDVNSDVISAMKNVIDNAQVNFNRRDSVFQYKNIVPMYISDENRIEAMCPWHS